MTTQITLDHYRSSLFRMLEEAFENVQSMFLDRGTSLFETLDGITADVASRPVSDGCSSIAAQVDHTRFYLDVMMRFARGEEVGEIDWDESWKLVSVTEEEWDALKSRLRESYQQVLTVLSDDATFDNEYAVGGSMAVLAHSVYHLGEIRRSLCTVGNPAA